MIDRTLYLFDTIEKTTVRSIIENMMKINKIDNENDNKEKEYIRSPIEIIINTKGGAVYDGLALINVIDNSQTEVHTYVYGLAASMGLLVAASGHKRFAGRLSTFMYHSVSNTIGGKLEHLKNRLDEVQRLQQVYDAYLLGRTRLGASQLLRVQENKRDWFLNPEEAVRWGIVDAIV
jgi:ATP-dependent Clp protease protease subunit